MYLKGGKVINWYSIINIVKKIVKKNGTTDFSFQKL